MAAPLEVRFWRQVDKSRNSDCWNWLGGVDTRGYGQIWAGSPTNKGARVHRISFNLHMGEIPSGLLVCHTCDNKLCVNPAHLFLGTSKDNAQDKKLKGRCHHMIGEHNGRAKLSEKDIQSIRYLYGLGSCIADIARLYKTPHATLCCVVHSKTWRHL